MAEAGSPSHEEQLEKKAPTETECLKAPTETECLKVVVRCRPFNEKEIHINKESVVTLDTKCNRLELKKPEAPETEKKCFVFDAVYDRFAKQSAIYDESCRGVVDSVLQGYDGTIFTYGQTGAGKTFTMEGVKYEPELEGIIPRCFEQIFQHIAQSECRKYLVLASYYTIYHEEIRDCLSKDINKLLELKENPDTGVYIKDLSRFVVASHAELEHVYKVGRKNHVCWLTNMSPYSTRVPTFFTITVESVEECKNGDKNIRVGQLKLVEMAGSERPPKQTSYHPNYLKEASKLYLSMQALGDVISALATESSSKSRLVPYRESKLTRLLKESLGGRAKTVMVAVIGPASCNYEETLRTLRYAERAKTIINRPKVNINSKDSLLKEFLEEMERLKAKLADITVSRDTLAGNKTQEEICTDNTGNDTEDTTHNQHQSLEGKKQEGLNDQLLEQPGLGSKKEDLGEKETEDASVVMAKIKQMEAKLLNSEMISSEDKNLKSKSSEV